MRVIVVGAGEVGSSIAKSLSDSHDVVVIDRDADIVERLTYELDVLAIEGDGTDLEVLQEAGVGDADIVVASTDDDEANIVICGTARTCCNAFTIARVKRPQYLRTWQSTQSGAFGVDFMVCTDLLAAQNIVNVLGLPTARDVDTFAGGTVQMAEFDVPPESPVADQTVAEADRFEELTFAGIIRDGEVTIPRGGTVIRADDDIVVIGPPESVQAFGAAIVPERNGPREIVIAGGSEIGYQIARLLGERGYRPRLIERDPDRARWIAEQLPNTTVMEHDVTDQDFLDRERVGEADVFIAALESDQQNLLATLLVKRLGAERTITVVETGEFATLFEAVGVDVAVSPREATAEEITRFTQERQAENIALIEGDQAEVIEVELDAESEIVGRALRDIDADLPEGVVVGAITRNGTFVTPRGDTVFQAGDHVVVFADAEAVDELSTLL